MSLEMVRTLFRSEVFCVARQALGLISVLRKTDPYRP